MLHYIWSCILYFTHCEKDVENNFVLYQRGQYLMTKLKHVNCVTHDTPQSAPPLSLTLFPIVLDSVSDTKSPQHVLLLLLLRMVMRV